MLEKFQQFEVKNANTICGGKPPAQQHQIQQETKTK